jgi:hypothetical protein
LRLYKPALFALLAANTVYFVVFGTVSKGIDSVAWLTLFVLFEAETSFAHRLRAPRARVTVRTLRLAAAAGVFAATIGYVFEDNVLDAANCVLWIAVVVLLELELRFPSVAERHRSAFNVAAAALYGSLASLALVWAVRGMWIDAYDAAIWLTAFATIELDILRRR